MSCSSGTHSHTQPADNDPITIPEISVNGTTITPNEIASEVQYHPSASPDEGVKKATEALIIQALLLQKARELGLDRVASPDLNGPSEEVMISLLFEQEAPAPLASEEDCQRYFDTNRQKFCSSELLEVRHILLAADPKDAQQRDTAKQAAEVIITTLQQSSSEFSALVSQHSACPSKETGGNLGQLSKGQTTPEFERQVFPLSTGLANHPIETRYGFHVIMVDRKISGRPLEFEHVREKVAQYLNEASQRKAISQYIHLLIGEADVEGIDLDLETSPLLQ